MKPALRIVKVGGSLLDLPDLGERLQRWLSLQSSGITAFIAGTGKLGDLVRTWDAQFALPASVSHGMCLEAIGVTTRLLQHWLPGCDLITDEQRLLRRETSSVVVFHAVEWLLQREPTQPAEPLPEGWDVTTDSIAARLAEITAAQDLVLLKSDLPGEFAQVDDLAASDYVDKYFPWAMRSVAEVRFVNLRDESFPQRYAFE